MRVTVVSPYVFPNIGGVEAWVEQSTPALLDVPEVEGVRVWSTRIPRSAPSSSSMGAAIVHRMPAVELVANFPMPAAWTRTWWRQWRAERRHVGPDDVVVTHTRFFATTVVGGMLARRCGATWVHVEHGSSLVQSGSTFVRTCARAWDMTIGRLVLRRADAVCAVSSEAASFIERLSGRRATVVRRGFDMPEQRQRMVDPAVVRVGYVGRLIDGKGVSDLLAAVADLDRGAVTVEIVGDGPERGRLEGRAKELGIAVAFDGQIAPDAVAERLMSFDVFVNPSHSEGLPTTVAEAAAAGVAIVATDVGGTSELVLDGETGLLVPARDPDRLTAAIRQLVDDPSLRRRLGDAARAHVATTFSWTRCRDALVQVMLDAQSARRA